jgi:trehalose 6-phosphate phosphatase
VKSDTQMQVDTFLQTLADASQPLLLLDYDGTLAPFHQQRDEAFPYPGVTEILEDIVREQHTRVVVISGRDTSETVPLLGIYPPPEVWGLHGLQRRTTAGIVETLPIDAHALNALSDADRWLTYQQVRERAEFKTGSIAMHWRGLSDSAIEDLRGRVLLGWKPLAHHSGLELLEFDGGVEFRVPDADKGDVVRLLLQEAAPDSPLAYLGDDATDERAFRAIGAHGLTILVRPRWRQTAAQMWIKPPDGLLHFLNQWLAASRRRRLQSV